MNHLSFFFLPLSLAHLHVHVDDGYTPTGSPVEEPDVLSSSSLEEYDDITTLHGENPTPLPHQSPQHVKQQSSRQSNVLSQLSRQSNMPSQQSARQTNVLSQQSARRSHVLSQQSGDGISPVHQRKLSAPLLSGSGRLTPSDSPSLSRRPLLYAQHAQGTVSS